MILSQRCNFCGYDKFTNLDKTLGVELSANAFPYKLSNFETLNYKKYSCNRCGSSDRDRLYKLFFEKFIPELNSKKILDIAPSSVLSKYFKQRKVFKYRTADLYMEGVDDIIDIMNMYQYENESFDIVICSHVLEHVDNDIQALKEIKRILNKSGLAIIMTPIINDDLAFDEDTSPIDDTERIRRFAQKDHVRLYSKKVFLERISLSGMRVKEYNYKDFGSMTLYKKAINKTSILYIVSR